MVWKGICEVNHTYSMYMNTLMNFMCDGNDAYFTMNAMYTLVSLRLYSGSKTMLVVYNPSVFFVIYLLMLV